MVDRVDGQRSGCRYGFLVVGGHGAHRRVLGIDGGLGHCGVAAVVGRTSGRQQAKAEAGDEQDGGTWWCCHAVMVQPTADRRHRINTPSSVQTQWGHRPMASDQTAPTVSCHDRIAGIHP